jgi:hypothetical protein
MDAPSNDNVDKLLATIDELRETVKKLEATIQKLQADHDEEEARNDRRRHQEEEDQQQDPPHPAPAPALNNDEGVEGKEEEGETASQVGGEGESLAASGYGAMLLDDGLAGAEVNYFDIDYFFGGEFPPSKERFCELHTACVAFNQRSHSVSISFLCIQSVLTQHLYHLHLLLSNPSFGIFVDRTPRHL